jgi:thioesterase domain-containing protein
MKKYRGFIGELIESGTTQANIHLIVAPDSKAQVDAHTGTLISSLEGWGDLTEGRFQRYAGDGLHRVMLQSPHLENNVALLKQILAACGNHIPQRV